MRVARVPGEGEARYHVLSRIVDRRFILDDISFHVAEGKEPAPSWYDVDGAASRGNLSCRIHRRNYGGLPHAKFSHGSGQRALLPLPGISVGNSPGNLQKPTCAFTRGGNKIHLGSVAVYEIRNLMFLPSQVHENGVFQ